MVLEQVALWVLVYSELLQLLLVFSGALVAAPVCSALPLLLQLVLLGSICVALNTLVDVMAVLGAQKLLKSGFGRTTRARLMTRASGVTMIVLGAWLALAKR